LFEITTFGPETLESQRLKRLGLEPSFQSKLSETLWPRGWALGQAT